MKNKVYNVLNLILQQLVDSLDINFWIKLSLSETCD